MLRTQMFSALVGGRVDVDKGVIYGVSVITEGVAKGHDKKIDATTVKQLFEIAKSHTNGVKVKLGHKEKPTPQDTCGTIQNFSIDGDKLRGDLHLLKSDENYSKLLELSQVSPDEFGLSVVFSGEDEILKEQKFARATELYSIDIVDRPAANPSGLFSEQTKPNTMTLEELADIYGLPKTATAGDIKAKVAELSAKSTIATVPTELSESVKTLTTKLAELETKASDAVKLAEKSKKDSLIAEAGREGKVIPLSNEMIEKTSFEVLSEMVSKLDKKVLTVTRQNKVLPVKQDERETALEVARTEGKASINAFFTKAINPSLS